MLAKFKVQKSALLLVALLALMLVLVACGGDGGGTTTGSENTPQEPAEQEEVAGIDKQLNIALSSDMLTFDSANYLCGQDAVTQNWVYETLVAYDEEMNIVPKLATDWEYVDAKSIKFNLRSGVFFTDGEPFNAEAVKVCLERTAKAPRGSGFAGWIESVEVVDDLTCIIHMTTEYAPALNNLCHIVTGIMSPKAIAELGDEGLVTTPVGTGPYKLVDWVPNDHVDFTYNDNYWGELPPIGNIHLVIIPEESTRLMALQTGDVDLIENPPAQEAQALENNPDTKLILDTRSRNVNLQCTYTAGPLQDVRVRKAIQCAVNAEEIVEGVLEGLARPADHGYIPPEIVTGATIDVGYDPEQAKALLAEAGYADGLTLELWTPEARYFRDVQVIEVIQQQLLAVGIKTNITVFEWATYLGKLTNHEAELFLMGWGFMTGEASQALRQTMFSGNAFNYSNYSNPKFDELLAQAEVTVDMDERDAIYTEINELICLEDAVVKPLYYMYNIYGCRSNVSGVRITANEMIDISKADKI